MLFVARWAADVFVLLGLLMYLYGVAAFGFASGILFFRIYTYMCVYIYSVFVLVFVRRGVAAFGFASGMLFFAHNCMACARVFV